MPSPYTDLKKVREVMKYRKQKLSFGQIAERMESDKKTVYRWYLIGSGKRRPRIHVGQLSTKGA